MGLDVNGPTDAQMSDNHGWVLFPELHDHPCRREATIVMPLPHPDGDPNRCIWHVMSYMFVFDEFKVAYAAGAGGGRRTRQLWGISKRCSAICRASRSACATPHRLRPSGQGGRSSSPTSTRWSTPVPAGRRGARMSRALRAIDDIARRAAPDSRAVLGTR